MKDFPQLTPEGEADLQQKLHHWCLAHGLTMYPANFQDFATQSAPVTLFPSPLPKSAFEKAIKIQKLYNELYARVSCDIPWMTEIMNDLVKMDTSFTGKLWNTYLKAVEAGITQDISLGLVRSDYMLDEPTNEIKQVEFNTISVSFGGLSPKVSQLHNYLNKVGAYAEGDEYYKEGDLKLSACDEELCRGFYEAQKLYKPSTKIEDCLVLFVVQENERNVFDQRSLEYVLLQKYGIKSQRLTFSEIPHHTRVEPGSSTLYYVSPGSGKSTEVSIVYYRTGYGPNDYKDERDWDTRQTLETSKAIKCPSLIFQLSGCKKIQQLLTDTNILKRYLPHITDSELKDLVSTFVKIYPLDNTDQGKVAKKLAIESSEDFVLKPQREGGGNNIYKESIPAFLSNLDEEQWNAYILMELIHPTSFKNKIVRNDAVYHEHILSELGIFGSIIWNQKSGKILSNTDCDYLLRSKFSSSNEGGVAAGFGCVDSLYLY